MISMELQREVPQYMAIPWLMTWVMARTVSAGREGESGRRGLVGCRTRGHPAPHAEVGAGLCPEDAFEGAGQGLREQPLGMCQGPQLTLACHW